MANIECPNCKQFKFSQNISTAGVGFVIILISILVPILVPTSSKYHGGYGEVAQTSTYVPIAMLGILLGIVMLLYGIFFPSKTIKYTCSNCKYEKKYKKWLINILKIILPSKKIF